MKKIAMIASAITLLVPEIASCGRVANPGYIIDRTSYQEDGSGGVSARSAATGPTWLLRNIISIGGEVCEVRTLNGFNTFDGGGRHSLRSICISASIKTISEKCLELCDSLTVTFESGSRLETIEEFAFRYSYLASICIPSSVEMLGSASFVGCQSLSSLMFGSGSKLKTISGFAFNRCSSLASICIPSSVERLGNVSFVECRSLSRLTFGSGSRIRTIEEGAFSGCSSLASICLPSSLERVEGKCFKDCTSLIIVEFKPNSQLKTIGSFAFSGCSSLASIWLPSSVERIEEGCFEGCGSLSIVEFEPGSQPITIEEGAIPESVETVGLD
ncbi:MAG: leucine-rich repeat domain-containing protein [Holosporales bacterium]|nr:leucine-rich repeat domain-containing protein [Holosporales bacterium]